jgi:hypothetical protein
MFVAAIAAVSLWSSAASAVLIYDVNDLNAQGVSSPTQASWIAVNLTGINNVTFAGVGGVNLADRNRGNNPFPNTNTDGAGGDIAHKDMWEDFIFAQEIAADVALPAGMDITVAGLSALTTYDVRLWAYDDISGSDVSGETPNMAWNGNAMMIGPTDPTSLNDQVVTYQAMSNGAGALMPASAAES